MSNCLYKFLVGVVSLVGLYVSALPSTRIIGGYVVKIENYPYQLSILRGLERWCGGALVSPRIAISAAHCFETPGSYYVRAGSNHPLFGGCLVKISKVVRHPMYQPTTADYDMALLTLNKPLTLSKVILPLKLPDYSETVPLGIGIATGWAGVLSTDSKLMAVKLEVYKQDECVSRYPQGFVTSRMFCAGYEIGGKDACQGDSGGPFAINNTLYGIISWGFGCGVPGYPGVYTNVPLLRRFIFNNTGL